MLRMARKSAAIEYEGKITLMSDVGRVVTTVLWIYALVMGVFLISENRTPKATLAWMLACTAC